MRKMFLWLLVIGAVGYAVFKGMAWYLVDARLREAASQVAGKGVLSWGAIRTKVTGQIQVEQLDVQLFDLSEPILIEKVLVDFGSPLTLLGHLTAAHWALPDQFHLTLKRLQLPLRSDLFKSWATLQPVIGGGHPATAIYACGETRGLGVPELLALGLQQVNLSADMAWQSRAQQAILQLELNAGSMGSLDMRLQAPPPVRGDLAAWIDPRVVPDQLELTLRDAGMMRRLAAWCASGRYEQSVDWAQAATQKWLAALHASGWQVSTDLIGLYQRWLSDGGELRLQLDPVAAFSWNKLADYSLNDLVSMSGLALTYNDQTIADLKMAYKAPKTPQQPLPKQAVVAAQAQAHAQAERWLASPVAEAPRWQGKNVRLQLRNGTQLEGRLVQAQGEFLDLLRRVGGGEVSYPLKANEIESMHVYRRASDLGLPMPEPAEPEEPEQAPLQDQSLDQAPGNPLDTDTDTDTNERKTP